jgi:hypothetical protein
LLSCLRANIRSQVPRALFAIVEVIEEKIWAKIKLMISNRSTIQIYLIHVIINYFSRTHQRPRLYSALKLITSIQIQQITFVSLSQRINHRSHILKSAISIILVEICSIEISRKGRAVNVVSAYNGYCDRAVKD